MINFLVGFQRTREEQAKFRRQFNAIDQNKDGIITEEELGAAME